MTVRAKTHDMAYTPLLPAFFPRPNRGWRHCHKPVHIGFDGTGSDGIDRLRAMSTNVKHVSLVQVGRLLGGP